MEYSHNNLTWFQIFVRKFVLVSVFQTALFFSHCPENWFKPPNAMKTKGNKLPWNESSNALAGYLMTLFFFVNK